MSPESPDSDAPAESDEPPTSPEGSCGEAAGSAAAADAPQAPAYPPDAPIPVDPNFRIELPGFEGPLDLLLYLIKKHELDVLDLPIAFITERYIEYLGLMEELNLDVASEYLVMAATLAHIKSKGLLPRPPQDQDEEEEDELDPRAELIRRLLEYQKYKRAAEALGSRGIAGRDVFPRGIPTAKAEGPAPLAPFSVFKLIDAFQAIVKRKKGTISLEVDAERVTIQERITQIVESLRRTERTPFERLFEGSVTTYDLVVTFLALLEMAKMRLVKIYQDGPTEPIYLEARVLDADAVQQTIAHAGADFGEEPVRPFGAEEGKDEPEPNAVEEDDEAEADEASEDDEADEADDQDEYEGDGFAGAGGLGAAPETEASTQTRGAGAHRRDEEGAAGALLSAEALENETDSEQDRRS